MINWGQFTPYGAVQVLRQQRVGLSEIEELSKKLKSVMELLKCCIAGKVAYLINFRMPFPKNFI